MNFLFTKKHIASLVFFRIVFGILAFLDVLVTWIYYHFKKNAFDPENYQFKYIGLEWAQAIPEPFMSIFFFCLCLSAIGICLGYHYKICASFFALGFTYVFLLEKCNYLNHAYLFCLLSFMMVLFPAHKAFSIDSLRGRVKSQDFIAYWPIFTLQFSMAIVYIFGGIAKINSDWLNAYPLKIWLPYKRDYFLIGPILEQEWLAWFMSYGGILHDLLIIPLMMFKKTRWFAFGCALTFHLMNTAIFQIGIFPWLSLALTALFFGSSFPLSLNKYLKEKLALVRKWNLSYIKAHRKSRLHLNKPTYIPSKRKAFITFSLFVFCLIMMLNPLRHHFFEGPVSWTEEGHRFSWRMMLRGKMAYGHFLVKNNHSQEEVKVKARDHLSKKQARKCLTHPDMIWQFGNYLGEIYRDKWDTDSVSVYPVVKAKLHFRKYQEYVDPNTDLTKEDWKHFESADWIRKLKKE